MVLAGNYGNYVNADSSGVLVEHRCDASRRSCGGTVSFHYSYPR